MKLKKLLAAALAVCVMGTMVPAQTALLPSYTATAATYEEGTQGVLTYKKYSDHVTISKCDFFVEGTVTIPSSIDGLPVTQIDEEAFRKCIIFTELVLPSSITYIGDYAFYACEALEKATIHGDLAGFAFAGCTALKEVTLSNDITKMEPSAFAGCTALAGPPLSLVPTI